MQQSPNSGKEDDAATYQTAIKNTGLAVSAAVAFGIGIGAVFGLPKAIEFFSGYVVEESLSVDNLFVFILLFEYFKVTPELQQRVLKWGIIGAAVLRGAFIAAGLVAIESFKGVLLVFAGFLIFSSFKILTSGEEEEEEDLSQNSVVKLASRLVQSTTEYDGDRFFTVIDGVKRATPLLLVLVCIELSDVMFAVDSIPAVFGVTEDPLIVLTSNLFAVLGLRALFQIISKVMKNLEYLESAVGLVLGFVGLKMVGGFFGVEVPPAESLAVILSLLGGGVGLSYLNRHDEEDPLVDPLQEAEREAEREREREADGGAGLSFKSASLDAEVPASARSPTDTKS
jgi:TerC family integral membrane protein